MLTVSDLTFAYPGKRVLHELSFTLPPGSVTALVGPNGAGKTTLLRCLAALHHPMAGTVRLQGLESTVDPPRYHRLLGFLGDDFGLYDALTVEQTLTFAALRNGVSKHSLTERVAHILAWMKLESYRGHPARDLSRGWRQRLAIAQAIIHQPPLLLLDEPASGLDPEARIELSGFIRQMREWGMTLLISSHILSELADYSTHLLVLRHGRTEGVKPLRHGEDRLRVSLARPWPELPRWLQGYAGVSRVTGDDAQASFDMKGGQEAWAGLLAALVGQGVLVSGFGEHGRTELQNLYLAGLNG